MTVFKKLIDLYINIYAQTHITQRTTLRIPSHLCAILRKPLRDKFKVFLEELTKPLNPSWVPNTQTCGCFPVGVQPVFKGALTSKLQAFEANFKNPVLKAKRLSLTEPGAPHCGPRSRRLALEYREFVLSGLKERRACRARTERAGAVAAEEAKGGQWHLASARPPRLAAGFGHLESLDLSGRQHPVGLGSDLSNRSRKKQNPG